jgi:sugar phosphate isomerase/epimerase
MPAMHDRRGFLRDAALITVGAVGGVAGGLAPFDAAAVEPVKRTNSPKFKFSVAGYSYNRLFRPDPKVTLEEFIRDCAKMGVEGTELTSYYFPTDADAAYLRQLKHLCFCEGLDISGTAVGNDFCHPPGPKRQEQIALVKRWIDNAEILGAPVIRIFSGRPTGDQSESDAHRLAVEGMEECCDYAGKHGVFLALENHGGLTTKIDGLLSLVKDVKSPWFGINVDTGNFQGTKTASEAYADLARMAPYALNVQVKVMIRLEGGKDEPCDFRRVAQIMKDANYRGYVVLEYEERDDPRTACPKYVDELRKAFA